MDLDVIAKTPPHHQAHPTHAPDPACQCVVWVRPGQPEPQGLIENLEKRGVSARTVQHPDQVMVELAQRQPSVVIVDHPQTPGKVAQLLAAVKRYYPHVACWRHEASASTGGLILKPYEEQRNPPSPQNHAVSQQHEAAFAVTQPNHQPPPPRDTTHNEPIDTEKKHPTTGSTDLRGFGGIAGRLAPTSAVSPLLTEDELAMLLGPGLGEDDSDRYQSLEA